jgi:hypothetical protein
MRLHGSSAEYCEKAERVIEAARACDALWSETTPDPDKFYLPQLRELRNAVRALDAPVPRYYVHDCGGQVVRCGERIDRFAVLDRMSAGLALVYAESAGIADRIAAALNAAEGKP